MNKQLKNKAKLVIKELSVNTDKPMDFMKSLKKLLQKFENYNWNCDFRVENENGGSDVHTKS